MKINKFLSKKYVLNVLFLLCFTFAFTFFIHGTAKAVTVTPAKVTGVVQTGCSYDSVDLTWDRPDNRLSYYIMYSTKINGKYKTISEAPGSIFGLSSGSTYYVKVYAVYEDEDNEVNIKGPESDPIEVVTALGFGVVPDKVWQTGYTTNSISLSWNPVKGANNYHVYYYPKGENYNNAKLVQTSDTSITVSDLSPNCVYDFYIAPTSKTACFETRDNDKKSFEGLVKPAITKISIKNYWQPFNKVTLKWNLISGYLVTDYQVQYSSPNAKIKTYNTSRNSQDLDIPFHEFSKVRVRAIAYDDGKRVDGDYSDWFYFSKQPEMNLGSTAGGIHASWNKIAGATDYTVYVSTNNSKKAIFKKVGTTKKTSFTIKKYGKTKLKKGKTYYFYVVANKKVGSKTNEGGASIHWSLKY